MFRKISDEVLIIIGLTIISFILGFKSCENNRKYNINEHTYQQNISALNDSIRTYKTKYGTLVHEKKVLISEKDEVDRYNTELSNEIKSLKDNPIVVVKYKTKIEQTPFPVPVYLEYGNITWSEDSTHMLLPFVWDYDTTYSDGNFRSISGNFIVEISDSNSANVKEFIINKDVLGISFTTGLTENKDGMVEIFIKSNYPNFKPTNIDGVLIDPRESKVISKYFPPKRWGLGVYGGYGLTLNPQYGNINSGLQIGVGVSYNLIQW